MRITCQYSGVTFQCQGFGRLRVTTQHPIMDIPSRTLVSRARDWLKGELDETERRLLFVALLKASDCFEFRVPAIPSKQTIESNMEFLLETVYWVKDIGDFLRLPKYRITEYTSRLKNIGTWLNIWHEAKRNYENKIIDREQRDFLDRKEEAFNRLIRSPLVQFKRYQKQLGRWAVDAAGAPEVKKEAWVELFNLRDNEDIMSIEKHDLQEMVVFLQDNLKIGGLVTTKIFSHMYELLQKRSAGIEGLIGLEDSDTVRERARRQQEFINNPFIILEDEDLEDEDEYEKEVTREKNRRLFGDVFAGKSETTVNAEIEAENKKRIIRLAPKDKPEEREYPDKVSYLKAFAAWRIAHREYEKQQAEILQRQQLLAATKNERDEDNTLELPFSEIDEEESNIIKLTARRAGEAKDE